jgi:hypothetical protein
MPSVRFEPTIMASERAKTVHALDRSATVTGSILILHEANLGTLLPAGNRMSLKVLRE